LLIEKTGRSVNRKANKQFADACGIWHRDSSHESKLIGNGTFELERQGMLPVSLY
jgi:hypothetical protein